MWVGLTPSTATFELCVCCGRCTLGINHDDQHFAVTLGSWDALEPLAGAPTEPKNGLLDDLGGRG
jgi:hypothetical protein